MSLHNFPGRTDGSPGILVAGVHGTGEGVRDLIDSRSVRSDQSVKDLGQKVLVASVPELAEAYDAGMISHDQTLNYAMQISHTRALGTNA